MGVQLPVERAPAGAASLARTIRSRSRLETRLLKKLTFQNFGARVIQILEGDDLVRLHRPIHTGKHLPLWIDADAAMATGGLG